MENSPSSNPGIINHVPSTEEIQTARQLEAAYNPEHAISRETMDLMLLGAGVKVERPPATATQSPTPPVARTMREIPDREPFIEPEHERTMSGAEHRKLLEQIFGNTK